MGQQQESNQEAKHAGSVGLFVTCTVDLFRPSVGFAAAHLIEAAGFTLHVPDTQTCCGQPAYNGGDQDGARAIARQVVEAFEPFDYVVAPSGSCAGMIRNHYARLFKDDPEWKARAKALAARTFELTQFLVDVVNWQGNGTSLADTTDVTTEISAAYHDSCSSLREMGIKDAPRELLARVPGLSLVELAHSDKCCGFGGAFAAKYGEVSSHITDDKLANVAATKADMLLGNDLGCLMQMAGRASRSGQEIEIRHIAEVLAGMTDSPAIGKGSGNES